MLTAAVVCISVIVAVRKRDWTRIKRIGFPVLAFYLCFILGITVFNRYPFDNFRFELELFWSYKEAVLNKEIFREIVLNYFLLLPLGVVTPLYIKKRWTIVLGALLSAAIEIVQFFTKRGLFEFDDIVGNSIGVLIGTLIFWLIQKNAKGDLNSHKE